MCKLQRYRTTHRFILTIKSTYLHKKKHKRYPNISREHNTYNVAIPISQRRNGFNLCLYNIIQIQRLQQCSIIM